MKKFTKLLLLLLCIAVVCAGLIIAVSADEPTFDLVAAIDGAQSGDTITLTGNATLTADKQITKSLTIDLNGYKLTSNAATAFILKSAVDLKIIGTGKIEIGGQIASLEVAGANFTVEGSSSQNKIDVLHTASVYKRILYTKSAANGNVTFKNVSLESKYHPSNLTANDGLIYSEGPVNFSFDNFEFLCDVKYVGKVSDSNKLQSFYAIYFMYLKGNGTVLIKDSDIYTTGGGIILNGPKKTNSSDIIVTLDNSTLRAVAPDGITRTMAFHSGGMWDKEAKSKGTVLIKDSIVEASYALFSGGKEDKTSAGYTEPQTIFEIQNSHIAITSNNANNGEHYTNTRGGTIRYDGTSTLATSGLIIGNVNTEVINGGLCFAEGTRLSVGSTTGFFNSGNATYVRFPDGSNAKTSTTYDIIFDPVGDPQYPWVVVKLVDGKLPEGIKDYSAGFTFTSGTATSNNFWYFDFSDCFKKVTDDYRETYMANDGAYSLSGTPSLSNGMFGHFGFDFKNPALLGSFMAAHINGNEALKYWVNTPDYSDIDSYFVLGDSRKGALKTQQYNVMVFDIDIGTDAGLYPEISRFAVMGRYGDSGKSANNSGTGISIAPDGTLTFGNVTKQLSTSEWNRITAVCYMNVGSKGTIYYYVNGELLGTTTAYSVNDSTSYLQGFRILMAQKEQTVGASILFDNLTMRGYADYLGDSSSAPDPMLYNYYTTETHKYVTDNYTASIAASVNGKLYGTLSEAIAAAEACGSVAKLERNVKEVLDVNAYVISNGYTIRTLQDSAGLIEHKDENGNVYAYTLDKSLNAKINFVLEQDGGNIGPLSAGIGAIPADLFSVSDRFEKIDGHWKDGKFIGLTATYNGSAFDLYEPLSAEFATANDGAEIIVTPVYEWQTRYAWVVERADGSLRTGGTETVLGDSNWSSIKLSPGETFVVQADTLTLAWNIVVNGSSNTTEEIYNFDINGHTLISDWRSSDSNPASYGTFNPGPYDTQNVYSSRPGGYLLDIGNQSKTDNTRRGGDLFRVDDPNVKLNVGDVTLNGVEYDYGANLIVNATAAVRIHGDAVNSEINIKGCTLVRSIGKHGNTLNALIYTPNLEETGDVSATTTVTDTTIVVIAGYLFGSNKEADSKSYYNTTFNNCTIISANGDLFRNVSSKNTITFNDCVIHGNIKATNESYGNVIVKNTISNLNAYAAPEGYVNAGWNVPMTLPEGAESLTVHKISTVSSDRNAAVKLNAWTITIQGSTAYSNYMLAAPAVKTVPASETVNVTYNGLDASKNVTYAVGGNVVDYTLPGYTSAAFVLNHNGKYTEDYAVGVEKGKTYVYNTDASYYTSTLNVSGFKVNVSLYADFGLNLYVPAKYAGMITVDGNGLTEVMNGTYLKSVSRMVNCDNASEVVTFNIDVTETVDGIEFNGNCTLSLSIIDYASVILDVNRNYTDADRVLVYNMLNYSNEATKYFGNGAADETVIELLSSNEYVKTLYTASTGYNEYIANSGFASLVESVGICLSPTPAFVINVKEGFKGTVYVSYAGNTITRSFDNFANEAATKDNKTIIVEGMKAYNLGTVLTVTLNSDSGETVTGRYSLDTYVKDSIGQPQFALAEALRVYAEVSEAYKNGTLAEKIEDYGDMIVEVPEIIYTNYSGKEFKVTFTDSEYSGEPVFTISDSRVTIENGIISAKGTFDNDTDVTVTVNTPNHKEVVTVRVSTYSKTFIEKYCLEYEAEGGTLSKVEENATIFVGDSYFTELYWEDFYQDFAGENAYLLGIGGSKVDEWFMCSERLVYPLNPSEIIVHIGFNDIYNDSPYTPAEIGERIKALLALYHEKLPDAKVYYCSIECSLYKDSFAGTLVINDAVKAFAEENSDWLTYVNTRPIFCNEETKEIYKDKFGVDKGSHPAVETYDEYKEYVDAARGKNNDESAGE